MNYRSMLIATAALAASGMAVRAMDAGDALFPKDMNELSRAEVIYENLGRDMLADYGTVSDKKFRLDGDAIYLRVHTDLGKTAYLDFDLGTYGPNDSDNAFLGGVGLRYLIYDEESWRLSAAAQAHYAPNLEGEVGGAKNTEYDLWNADAALLLSAKIPVVDEVTLFPYIGPQISTVQIDGDMPIGGGKQDLSADEDSALGLVVGLSAQIPGWHTLRIEGRYYGDQFSVSGAFGVAF